MANQSQILLSENTKDFLLKKNILCYTLIRL